jgi:hypothetical protein
MLVEQFDVDQMYTNLDKNEIREAVLWFFEKVREGAARYSRTYARDGSVAVRREGRRHFEMRFGKAEGEEVQLNFNVIMQTVMFDLENVYFTLRGRCYQQKKGVPIGGFLGAMYAICQCARVEQAFLDGIDRDKTLVIAYRYIDDCHIWMFAGRRDRGMRETKQAKRDLWTPGRVYSADLTIKDVNVDDCGTYRKSVFVGAELRTDKRTFAIEMHPHMKNWESIMESKRQLFKMFKGPASFTSDRSRYGSVVTALCRMQTQSTNDEIMLASARKMITELRVVGMSKALIRKAVNTMISRNSAMMTTRLAWERARDEICRQE